MQKEIQGRGPRLLGSSNAAGLVWYLQCLASSAESSPGLISPGVLRIQGLVVVCVHSSLIPLQHSPLCGALLWPGGSPVSRGPTCLLPLFCPGAALAPAAGLGAGIQTDQGQEPGKEGRHGDSILPAGLQEATQRICTVSCLQEAEGGWCVVGEEICSPSDACLCAEVPQAKRCAGARPGRMVLPQNTAGLRTVLVLCCRMQGPESHCTFILPHCCSLASPLLMQLCLCCGL